MATQAQIVDRIGTVTQRCYGRDRDNLTVNIVRNIVELELGLEHGTLRSGPWKEKSKEKVLSEVQRLDRNLPVSPTPPKPATPFAGSSQPTKRKRSPTSINSGAGQSASEESSASYDVKPPGKKKRSALNKKPAPKKDEDQSEDANSASDSAKTQKKSAPPLKQRKRLMQRKRVKEESENEGEDINGSDGEGQGPEHLMAELGPEGTPTKKMPPKRGLAVAKKTAPKAATKGKTIAKRLSSTQVVDSSDDDIVEDHVKNKSKLVHSGEHEDDEEEEAKTKSQTKSKTKGEPVNDDESEMSEVFDLSPQKKTAKKKPSVKDDESEMSDVLDPKPAPKRGQKSAATRSKAEPKSKASADPQASEIKTLTTQLGKCGVRKVWGAYLKKALGSDADHRTKVSHLKNMLKEIGMEGRFSEQRAKEIRTKLELEKDLEVLEETSKGWGLDPWGTKGSAGRPNRRAAAKNLKEPELKLNLSDDESEGEEEVVEEDDDEDSDADSNSHSGSGSDGDGSGNEDSDEEPEKKKRVTNGGESEESEFDDESD